MQKRVCIIDLSAPEFRVGLLIDDRFEPIDVNLPWEVGFRQEADGTLVRCFGDALDRLDPNQPEEVLFTELDVHFKEITDTATLECLFHAFFEEIFHRRLPEHGYEPEAMWVYLITPYHWKTAHRQQLRRTLKHIENNSRRGGLNPPNVTLRGMLSQVLCLAVHYQQVWEDLLANVSKLHLFLIDFTRHDLILYQLFCEQSADYITMELCNVLRLPDFFMDIEKQVSDIHHALKAVGETVPVVVGFSGTIDHSGRAIIELLQARCRVSFLELQEAAALLGGAKLIQQFEPPKATGRCLAKPLHFIYHFCFGVRLPDGQWIELVSKAWRPPYHRKKVFRVRGTLEKFDIHLFCGLSLTDNSDVHHLATLEIGVPENSNFSSRNPREFILSITLDDSTHGTFAAHLPSEPEPKSIEFTLPVLMD